MDVQNLTPFQLSRRWRITQKTLRNWRWEKKGPPFIKICGQVLYRLTDIEQYEADHMHNATMNQR